jgi:hypothetical protein
MLGLYFSSPQLLIIAAARRQHTHWIKDGGGRLFVKERSMHIGVKNCVLISVNYPHRA